MFDRSAVLLRISCDSPEQCQRFAEEMQRLEPVVVGTVVTAILLAGFWTIYNGGDDE